MDEKLNHELAIAYAQAKLIKRQQDSSEDNGCNSELRSFLKSYYYAAYQLPIENDDLDEYF